MSVEEDVRQFIIDEIGWDGGNDLGLDFPLIERGVVDSMAIFQLIAFLEGSYDIEVEDEDLVPENFATISSIGDLVSRRRA